MSASAIDELRTAFEDPFWLLGHAEPQDRETVVLSWPSVPVELVRAAGLVPVFARGSNTPTPAADRVLERDLFPNRLRQLVEAALAGRLSNVAAIVLPRTSDADYKCFLYLNELVRLGTATALPPILLFDLLHSEQPDTLAYNADRARDLFAKLATRQHRVEDLRTAIVNGNRARVAARRLSALRTDPPRIAGKDVLPLLGALWQLDPERFVSLASTVAESVACRPPLGGPRVLLAGAPIDGTALHAAIEAEGGVVVAELSPFGSSGTSTDVEDSDEPFAALTNHYRNASIDARLLVDAFMRKFDGALSVAQAVVLSLPPDDASFGWDYPRVRKLLATRAVPHTVLIGDPTSPVTAPDRDRIRALLDAVSDRQEVTCG